MPALGRGGLCDGGFAGHQRQPGHPQGTTEATSLSLGPRVADGRSCGTSLPTKRVAPSSLTSWAEALHSSRIHAPSREILPRQGPDAPGSSAGLGCEPYDGSGSLFTSLFSGSVPRPCVAPGGTCLCSCDMFPDVQRIPHDSVQLVRLAQSTAADRLPGQWAYRD